jgi:hypothetical protein
MMMMMMSMLFLMTKQIFHIGLNNFVSRLYFSNSLSQQSNSMRYTNSYTLKTLLRAFSTARQIDDQSSVADT